MSKGILHIHLVDKNGVGIAGKVAATRSGETYSCTASGGMCVIPLEKGVWTLYARSSSGAQESGIVTKQVTDNAYVTMRLRPAGTAAVQASPAAGKVQSTVSKSSTRMASMGRIRLGDTGGNEMATSACKWKQIAWDSAPAALFMTNADGSVSVDKNYVEDAGEALSDGTASLGKQSLMLQALRTDFLATGEDQADFDAELERANLYFGAYEGKLYGIAQLTSGYWVYRQDCGLTAYLPYVLGGAVLAGVGGFAIGRKQKHALVFSTVGLLAGGVLGYGAARLFTDATTKAYQKMGMVTVRRGLKQVNRIGMIDAHRVGFIDVKHSGKVGAVNRWR